MHDQNKADRPPWYYQVKRALVDQDLTITDLARDIGRDRVYLSRIINGKSSSRVCEKMIFDRLGIDYDKIQTN